MRTTVEMAPSHTPVRAVMSPGVIAISGDTTVAEAAATMSARRTHAVLVIDSRTRVALGWIIHDDVLEYLRQDPLTTRAADIVSHEAAYIHPSDTVEEAAARMIAEGVSHLLVGYGPQSVPDGVISSWDLVAYYAGHVGRR